MKHVELTQEEKGELAEIIELYIQTDKHLSKIQSSLEKIQQKKDTIMAVVSSMSEHSEQDESQAKKDLTQMQRLITQIQKEKNSLINELCILKERETSFMNKMKIQYNMSPDDVVKYILDDKYSK